MTLPRYLKNLDSFIAAIIGFIAIYCIYTSYSGIGISPDSIMYASTAHSIAHHFSLITFNGTHITFFPVFYPFYLGVILFITRVDTVTAAPVINGLMFAAIIFITGYTLSKFKTHSGVYKWLILLAIILSPGLLEIYTYLWSETLFILVIMLFVPAYHYYMRKHTLGSLVAMAVIVAISCITRYAGVTLVATGGLLLLLDNELSIRKKVIHILIYGCIAISLLVGNLLLNYFATGLSTGTREPSITPFIDNLYYCGTVMCDWAALPSSMYPYAAWLSALVFIVLGGFLVFKTSRGGVNTYENIHIAFALVYGLFIVVSSSISRYERINSRLLSPMFIPLLIGITSWVPDVLRRIPRKKQWYYALPFVIMMLAFEYATGAIDYQRWYDENDYGVPGYTDDDWNTSEFIKFLKTHKHLFKPGVPIYSDADEAVYFFTGESSTLLPHRYFKNDVEKVFAVKHYYLIWFSSLNNKELIGLEDLQQRENLKLLYHLKDGEIYEYNADGK